MIFYFFFPFVLITFFSFFFILFGQKDYMPHVAEAIVGALGLAQIDPAQAQERPNPANVGTGEGAGLEGAQIGARAIKPERPREGE